jgi:hypothetical protein
VIKSLSKFILICVLAGLNLNAKLPSRSTSLRPQRQQISQAEQVQKIINILRANKMNYLEHKNLHVTPEAQATFEKVIGIYDRLIFVLTSRYTGGDAVDFLSEYCITLAENEQRAKKTLVNFYAHLSDVIRNAKNEREDIAAAIENYIHAAPVTEPLTAARFIMNNSYSDGKKGQRAYGINNDDLGPSAPEVIAEAEKVSDFEFSGEVEEWFARNLKVEAPAADAPATTALGTAPQTSEQDLLKIQPSEQPTTRLGIPAPVDMPASNNVNATPPPPTQSSQNTPASTSEPTSETK